ncbi:MAG: anthranilate synthase component I [Deltaproteobacteria bacterium]|nr:anthranilate synthase component I [Deltaproteobacteria bacterium]MBW1930995.1 anthranilate synthase component I [Deltaproteobacteria bacterium]MBW2026471.1 anthranilate synthase component I [Deltaproteobacteria bacterium]MBW2126606.1 anthranilate synthase component I [Deltaproteobacteria bacterium]
MRINPSLDEFRTLASQGNLISLYCELLADTETPVSAYLKLREKMNSFSFLLESAEFGRTWGRYSFIGWEPFLLVLIYSERTEVFNGALKADLRGQDPIGVLRQLSREIVPVGVGAELPFQGGLVGYINYDFVRRIERVPSVCPYDEGFPEGVFMAPRRIVVFDHLTHKITVMHQIYLREGQDLESQYGVAVESIAGTIMDLKQSLLAREDAGIEISPLSPNMEKPQFEQIVRRAKRYIEAGEVIQVVLSQRLSGNARGDSFTVYRRLRSLNPSPYMFYLDFGETKLIGSSPQVLVRLKGETIKVRPIAGTRPRGKSDEEDRLLERELLADEKERAEHLMLVDLGRNDVGKVAVPGSVKVNRFMEIEPYSHVMHLVSDVEARLRPDRDCFDAFVATFPAGTVTGAPKVRAMEIISQLEPSPRGPYAGAVGYFAFNGDMDFCITIRTIVLMGKLLWVQAGAGIVYDSIPEREYEETLRKTGALIKAMEEREWE